MRTIAWRSGLVATLLLLASCAGPQMAPPSAPPAVPASGPAGGQRAPSPAASAPTAGLTGPGVVLRPARWRDLPGWTDDDLSGAWGAFQRDCRARLAAPLAAVCARAAAIAPTDTAAQRAFFEAGFRPWQVIPAAGGDDSGLITGYYEPVLRGALQPDATYSVPVWGLPDDLVPRVAGADGVTGGRRVVQDGRQTLAPYWSRGQIQSDPAVRAALDRHVVVWLENPVDALFLQVQGSGLVRLPDGGLLRLRYAGTNGWPYRSVGRWLLDTGRVQGTVTMSVIRAWAQLHPDDVAQMLAANPRVVFFSATPAVDPQRGPVGALGVPLTAMRSVAVDKSEIALGLPLWLSATLPPADAPATATNGTPFDRLVFAQDVGSAITGAVRADLFTGTGDAAGDLAGRLQSLGRIWVLLPR